MRLTDAPNIRRSSDDEQSDKRQRMSTPLGSEPVVLGSLRCNICPKAYDKRQCGVGHIDSTVQRSGVIALRWPGLPTSKSELHTRAVRNRRHAQMTIRYGGGALHHWRFTRRLLESRLRPRPSNFIGWTSESIF